MPNKNRRENSLIFTHPREVRHFGTSLSFSLSSSSSSSFSSSMSSIVFSTWRDIEKRRTGRDTRDHHTSWRNFYVTKCARMPIQFIFTNPIRFFSTNTGLRVSMSRGRYTCCTRRTESSLCITESFDKTIR